MRPAEILIRSVSQRYCNSSWGSYIGRSCSFVFSAPGSDTGHGTHDSGTGRLMYRNKSLCAFIGLEILATFRVIGCTCCSPASSQTPQTKQQNIALYIKLQGISLFLGLDANTKANSTRRLTDHKIKMFIRSTIELLW